MVYLPYGRTDRIISLLLHQHAFKIDFDANIEIPIKGALMITDEVSVMVHVPTLINPLCAKRNKSRLLSRLLKC